jgi:hypothetical protein
MSKATKEEGRISTQKIRRTYATKAKEPSTSTERSKCAIRYSRKGEEKQKLEAKSKKGHKKKKKKKKEGAFFLYILIFL